MNTDEADGAINGGTDSCLGDGVLADDTSVLMTLGFNLRTFTNRLNHGINHREPQIHNPMPPHHALLKKRTTYIRIDHGSLKIHFIALYRFFMEEKLRIYLDNCAFNRPFDDQNQLKVKLETEAKLFIQKGILDNKYELVWSYILEYENNQNKFDDRRNTIYDWKNIAKIHCVENDEIIEYAEELKRKNIRIKDALHIACSVYAHSDYLITTDRQLFNLRISDIRIINPLTFINELEG